MNKKELLGDAKFLDELQVHLCRRMMCTVLNYYILGLEKMKCSFRRAHKYLLVVYAFKKQDLTVRGAQHGCIILGLQIRARSKIIVNHFF